MTKFKGWSKKGAGTKGNKYNNTKTEYKGELYDSKKEAAYAGKLDMLVRGKQILSWERQKPMPIVVNGDKICKYICDFVVTNLDGSVEHIDVKGVITATYRLKKKLVKAVYGINIIEV